MSTITGRFEFEIKRGVVNNDDLEIEIKNVINSCINLCKVGKHEKAIDLLYPLLSFEWMWENCDGDPSDIAEDTDDVLFKCNKDNSLIKLGVDDGCLVITAAVYFNLALKDGVTEEFVTDWLDENSAYACGHVDFGGSYAGSEGDNVWLVELTSTVAPS